MARSTSERRSIMFVAAAVVLVGMTAFSLVPGRAAAETFDLYVYGTVYDDAGLPAVGASILVEDLTTHATVSDTTDSNGQYSVYLPAADWSIGDTIEVTSTYNTVQKTNTTVADELSTAEIDIHYDYAIPEFGSFPGVLVATLMVGAVAVFAVRKRKA